MSKPAVIGLFSGIGGIELGFMQSGFEIVLSSEIDRYACTTYRNNLEGNVLIEGDICGISANIFPKADVIAAGFPCQPFSIMGKQKGFCDPRGNMFFQIIRIAEIIKPKVIFLENVKNLIYHDKGKTFITIYNSLAGLGYGVRYAVLDASTHGNIPQERNRTFIAAFFDYDIMNAFSFPDRILLEKSIDDIIDRSVKHSEIYYYKEESKYYSTLNRKIIDKTGIYRIDDGGIANRKYTISPTLKANMGTYHDRVPIIRDDFGIRKLTPHECLALQGFPKTFVFRGIPIEAAYKQAGNTVCVPVIKRIAEKLYTVLK